jgi:hypothetical protein
VSDHLDFAVPQPVPTGEILFRFRVDQSDTHVHLRVFAGQSEASLGLAGQLVLRAEEWHAFRAAMDRTARVRQR